MRRGIAKKKRKLPTCEREPRLEEGGRASSVGALTRPESRVRARPPDARDAERAGECEDGAGAGLVSRSRRLRRSLLLRRFCRSMISSMLSKRRSEEEAAVAVAAAVEEEEDGGGGSTGSVLMGVAGGKEQGASGAADDMERDFARAGCGSKVGLLALSVSDSTIAKARKELAFSAVRNWRI